MLILSAANREEVLDVVAQDPFKIEGLVYELTVTEWDPIFGRRVKKMKLLKGDSFPIFLVSDDVSQQSCRGHLSKEVARSSGCRRSVQRFRCSMAVCTENLNSNVLTMKSAQYGARIYDAGSLNLARDRRILVQ
jgi:hypothetical protein